MSGETESFSRTLLNTELYCSLSISAIFIGAAMSILAVFMNEILDM